MIRWYCNTKKDACCCIYHRHSLIFSTVFFFFLLFHPFLGGGICFYCFWLAGLAFLWLRFGNKMEENKEPTCERVVLNNSNFPHGKPREYAFIFSRGSLNQPLVGKVRSQLKDACCSDFLNVQLIRFAATNRPGVRGDQTRRQTMKSHNISCELKAIYKAWRCAPASVLHTAVSKHIMAVFSSALVEIVGCGHS